jgi:diguanylate cyclase
MTGLRSKLPRKAWRRIYRITTTFAAISVALSVVLTNVIMEVFSAGINLQGLMVAIIMPIALGTPMTFVLLLKHEQLRQANDQLERLATIDWLTACLNRGAFTRIVQRRLAGEGAGSEGALFIIDADDFKAVNDGFGHHHGDEALQLIADAIRKAVRSSDVVGRLGGEEFGVFLADADRATADRVAEQIRFSIAAIQFLPNNKPCPLSVSIGGATYARRAEFADLYRLADLHLYQAKNAGRDCVAMMQAA